MEVRIVGDRIFPLRATREAIEPWPVPAVVPPAAVESKPAAPDDDERPTGAVVIPGPDGRTTRIWPVDHVRPLPWYRRLAEAAGVPVSGVWLVLNADRNVPFRGAVHEGQRGHVVHLNVGRLQPCVLHRLSTFEHELEHARRGDCQSAAPHSLAEEEACDEAADQRVRAAVTFAQRSAPCAIEADRCATCAAHGDRPCTQGEIVYRHVQQALAPL